MNKEPWPPPLKQHIRMYLNKWANKLIMTALRKNKYYQKENQIKGGK